MKRIQILVILTLVGGVILFTSCQQPEITAAKLYLTQKSYDPDKAIEQSKLAIEKTPNNAEAHFVLGRAYGEKKMYREMNGTFNKSLDLSPKFASDIEQYRTKYWIDLFNDGVYAIKQDKLDKAVDMFNLAIEILPNKIDAHKNLAYAYSLMNNDSSAIETYLKAAEVDSTDLEVKNFLGILYYKNKNYENAVEVLKEVVSEAEPQSKMYSDALYNMAYSYDLMGQSDKAIEAYQNALEAAPNDKDLLFNMGRLYYMQDKYNNAIETFKRVLSDNPDDFDTNFNIGNAYLQMEKFAEAIPYFEKAVESSSDNPTAWNNLGVCYVRTGMPEKGKAAFDKSDELRATE